MQLKILEEGDHSLELAQTETAEICSSCMFLQVNGGRLYATKCDWTWLGKKKHTVTHFGLVKSPWVSDALAWRVWFQLAMARCSPQKQALKFRVFEWMKYITVLYIIYNQDNLMLMKINCPSQFYSFWCFPKAAPHAKAWSGFGCSPRIFRTSACSPENKINLNQEDWI